MTWFAEFDNVTLVGYQIELLGLLCMTLADDVMPLSVPPLLAN